MPYGMNHYLKMTRTKKQQVEPLTLNLDGNCSSPLVMVLDLTFNFRNLMKQP